MTEKLASVLIFSGAVFMFTSFVVTLALCSRIVENGRFINPIKVLLNPEALSEENKKYRSWVLAIFLINFVYLGVIAAIVTQAGSSVAN